jgi:transcriptional regulator PpsR
MVTSGKGRDGLTTPNDQAASSAFSRPDAILAGLGASTVDRLIATAADLALVIDANGTIQDVSIGNEELKGMGIQAWLGKTWLETVTVESRPKIEALMRECVVPTSAAMPKWRQVNHPMAQGADLAVSYAVLPLDNGRSSSVHPQGYSLAIGRDLRAQAALQQRLVSAQVSMERDYWRLRHIETRYRLLFQETPDPLLILDADTEKLEEANPSAHRRLGDRLKRSHWTPAELLDSASLNGVQQALKQLRTTGVCEPVSVRFLGETEIFQLIASLFRQENSSHMLLRFIPEHQTPPSPAGDQQQQLLKVMDNAPDAFVMTGLDGRILTVNQAFLELAQIPNAEMARGESLERWLGRSGVDLNVLLSNLRQRGMLRLFATRLKGEYGSTTEVEISAVALQEGETPCLGFTIRDVGRRLNSDVSKERELPRSASQMAELVGRVPLKDIVRETTDLIEQLCIEAALELTSDNRASAAEMLGLSRQSLYVKLRRFGMGESEASE